MSSIKYNIKTEDQVEIHTIHWKVPNFETILKKSITNGELRPTEIIYDREPIASDFTFQVKMQFRGPANELTDIFYQSPTRMLLKFILKRTNRTCLNINGSMHPYKNYEKLLVDSQYHTVREKKWQHVYTFVRNSNIPIDLKHAKARDKSLKFEFIAIKVIRMNSPEVKLNNDYENILNNGMFSDVTMKSADGVEYKAHKVVLAGRSAVLKAHFEHNTTECVTNIVESPLESEVLREVLTFIYSGKAPSVDEIPEKLIAAADYYQLSDLISLCGETLQKRLTVENAIETLQLADSHSANALKEYTLELISGLPAGLITKTEGWAKIKSIELVKEIFEYITVDNMDTVK